jgi:glycosyltransferase involved in cell wall biosynthesis
VAAYHTHFVSYFPYYGMQAMEPMGWSLLRHFHNSFLINLAPSASACQEIQAQGIKNVELWERGVDLRLFSPHFYNRDTRRVMGDPDKPKLLFVGRLVKEKNIDDLLDAAKLLRSRGHEFDLAFIGDGPMKEEIKQREPGAYLPGYLHGHELAAVYASSDLFVFPSTTETFGNVLQEAYASGLPVIGVRAGGSQDLIQHGLNGLICEPKNPAAFAANIELLLKNQNLRRQISENALNLIQERTWSAINTRLLHRYEALIRDFRAGRVAYKETFRDWLALQIAYPGDWMHAA